MLQGGRHCPRRRKPLDRSASVLGGLSHDKFYLSQCLSSYLNRTRKKFTPSCSRSRLIFYQHKHPPFYVNEFSHPARKHALSNAMHCRQLCSKSFKSSNISTSKRDLTSCPNGYVARRTIQSSTPRRWPLMSWCRQGNQRNCWIYCVTWRVQGSNGPMNYFAS